MQEVPWVSQSCVSVSTGCKHTQISLGTVLIHPPEDIHMPVNCGNYGYGISNWSTGSLLQWQGPKSRPPNNFRHLVFTAFQEQQSIGWDQAIRGRLSVHWKKMNTQYCQEQLHQGNLITHSMWSSNIVQGMWQYGMNHWVGQNEFLYGKSKEDQLAKKTKEVDDQIVIIYQTDQQQVRPPDSHFFHMP